MEITSSKPNERDAYDEDFEDYDDDFEHTDGGTTASEDEKEMDVVRIKTNYRRNDDISTTLRSTIRSSTPLSSSSEYSINAKHSFSAGRPQARLPERKAIAFDQLSNIKGKQAHGIKRFQDLKQLIELDFRSFTLFDMPPLNEYELYIRNYGQSNTVQASTQYNEDTLDRDIQTEEVALETKWCQMPAEGILDNGGETEGDQGDDVKVYVAKLMEKEQAVDSIEMVHFLGKAVKLVETLLQENLLNEGSLTTIGLRNEQFSTSTTEWHWELPELQGRKPIFSYLLPPDGSQLLISWSANSKPNLPKGLITLWILGDPQPFRLLVCESEVINCCVDSHRHHIILGSSMDGSVVIWNLKDSLGKTQQGMAIIPPSYCSDGVFTNENIKFGCDSKIGLYLIMDGLTQGLPGDKEMLTSNKKGGLRFMTIDESGLIEYWSLTESPMPLMTESEIGSPIGSHIKLRKNGNMQVLNPNRHLIDKSLLVYDCSVRLEDNSRLLVGSSAGDILHISRFFDRCIPSWFRLKDNSCSEICRSISISKSHPSYFLAGYQSGSVGLFSVEKEFALKVWEVTDIAIKSVHWSPHRGSVFYVLDVLDSLYIWDFLEQDASYLYSYKALEGVSKAQGDESVQSLVITPSPFPSLLFVFNTGRIVSHQLKPNLHEPVIDEGSLFKNYLQSLG